MEPHIAIESRWMAVRGFLATAGVSLDRRRPLAVLAVLAKGCILIAGCSGSGRFHVIPTDTKRLAENEPLIEELPVHRCYWWTDEQGRLCLAMEATTTSFLGEYGRFSMSASFILPGPWPQADRNYPADRQTMRLIIRKGLNHTRMASLSGILSIEPGSGHALRGRFRVSAKTQSFFVATGWHGDQRTWVVGEFKAVPGKPAGSSILARTEANGMARYDHSAAGP